jgi:hypothetical protein
METLQQIQIHLCYLNLLNVVTEDWQHLLRYGQQIETLLIFEGIFNLNPLNAKLKLIFHMLALLGAHRIFDVSVLRVKRTALELSIR